MRKSFQFRLYPTKSQEVQLEIILETGRRLYNAALAERRDTYQNEGRSLNYYDQANALKTQRQQNVYLAQVNFSACQDILRRLDKAFKAFFRRIRMGEKPGYPRFKGRGRYDSLTFPSYGDGCKIKEGRLYLQNVGLIKLKWHRNILGRIKTVTVRHQLDAWYASFSCEVEPIDLPPSEEITGVDLGIKHLAITSQGEFFEHPHYLRKAERHLKYLQRSVSRKKKGSKRRKKAVRQLAKLHQHVANQRRDMAHKVSRVLVNKYGLIAFEDLNAQGLLKNHHLAKSIADAGWHQLVQYTTYKAAEAGRRVVLVDPRFTSQDCSTAGCTYRKTDLTLAVRTWECPTCGVWHDRDINAAQNILQKALIS